MYASTVKSPSDFRATLAALERRRYAMLTDVDVSIVESRRVKCGICEQWIKGGNNQEYSLHHWLKHKEKCIGSKKAIEVELVDPIVARKAMLDADPDLKVLQPHKAFCNICNEVSSYYHRLFRLLIVSIISGLNYLHVVATPPPIGFNTRNTVFRRVLLAENLPISGPPSSPYSNPPPRPAVMH
jgi:hypothetical protein